MLPYNVEIEALIKLSEGDCGDILNTYNNFCLQWLWSYWSHHCWRIQLRPKSITHVSPLLPRRRGT